MPFRGEKRDAGRGEDQKRVSALSFLFGEDGNGGLDDLWIKLGAAVQPEFLDAIYIPGKPAFICALGIHSRRNKSDDGL